MIGYIIIAVVLVLFFSAVGLCFSMAFVRHDDATLDDIESPNNDFLDKYRPFIREGLTYIEKAPHEWIFCKSFDGLRLAARYFETGSDKTILLFHGYRSSASRDFSCAVKMYCELGFNVLLADQRSHANSEGKFITFGVKERRDVLSWVNFLLENKRNDMKIVLGGMSMGATTVLLSAGLALPDNVKAIIADCGFSSPAAIIKKVARQSFHISAIIILPCMDLVCRFFAGFSVYGVSTEKALRNSDIPVLFIHGEADNFVPCEMSRNAYKAAGKNSEILTVKDADHGMSFLVDTENVSRKATDFLKKHVSP